MPLTPVEVANEYAIQRPSGDPSGRTHPRVVIDETPADGSHRLTFAAASRKNSRLGTDAQTAIVPAEVEKTSLPSLVRRTWSGAVSPVPPTWKVWKYATYSPSPEKPRKLSSWLKLMPRPGAAGRMLSTRLPEAVTKCHALVSRKVSKRPSGLKA